MNEDKEIKIMLIITFVVFTFVAFITLWCNTSEKYYYEYIDLDNNKGIAVDCSYKFVQGKAGGQGSPVCILPEGTVIQVKQYTRIIKE